MQRIRQELAAGASAKIQYRVRNKAGEYLWLEGTVTNLVEEPSIRGFVVNFHDITEHYEAEQALRASEQKFRAIWDNTQDAMLIVNDEMQYVEVNPAACALYGVTREELLTRSMSDFVTPEKKDTVRTSLQKLVKQGQRNGHFQMRNADHTLREIEYSARANILPGLHLSVMRDVTERNRAEEDLISQNQSTREAAPAIKMDFDRTNIWTKLL